MQVSWLIGERALIGNAHVEQAPGIRRRISDPAANGPIGFNRHDVRLVAADAPRDVERRQRACRPAANNR